MILTAENTAVVLDSTADFPDAPARFPGWRVVPLHVQVGEESFRDHLDLDPGTFYARLRGAAVPVTTSQPTPVDFLDAYRSLDGFERIVSLHIAGTLSGTVESARRAAAELGGDRVVVVDTRTASAAIALLALAIGRRLERGTSDDELAALVERFRRDARLLFSVDTLEYLQRGGRIGRARALAGQLLNVKPILTIRNGEVVPLRKVRSNQKAFLAFAELFAAESADAPSLRVALAHAAAPERLDALRRMVERTRPQARIELATELGPVLGAHAGPGTAGLFWFDDPDR
jgi:DegV family protein with EDD domain